MTSYAQTLKMADRFGSKLVGYKNTNVYDKLDAVPVSVKDFGATGDGVTDDTAAIVAAFASIDQTARDLIFPPGRYIISSTPVFHPGLASLALQRERRISGYGAILSGALGFTGSLMKVSGGFTPYGCTIEGFTFDAHGNASLASGLVLENTTHAIVRNNSFPYGNTTATYDPIIVQNSNPADQNTGSFWTKIESNNFRVISGGEVQPRCCIHLRDTCNATNVFCNSFSGATTGILIDQTATIGFANGVDVLGNWFESMGTSVSIPGTAGQAGITGFRFDHNRVEQGNSTVVISMTGATIGATYPPIIGPNNYIVPSGDGISTLIYNPNNLDATSWAAGITPANSPDVTSKAGITSRAFSGDPFAARAGNLFGFSLSDYSNNFASSWRMSGSNSIISGVGEGQLLWGKNMTASTTGVSIRQIMRTATFAAATTAAVVFPFFAEEDANYRVLFMPRGVAGPAGGFFSTAQTTAGFTANASASWTGTVDMLLHR